MADSSNHFYYYLYNLQGDVIALADASTGKLAATYTYDAWGKIVKINGIDPNSVAESSIAKINPFRYRGYYYDQEKDVYAMAFALGANTAPVFEPRHKKGYYSHFHTNGRKFNGIFGHFHVWFSY